MVVRNRGKATCWLCVPKLSPLLSPAQRRSSPSLPRPTCLQRLCALEGSAPSGSCGDGGLGLSPPTASQPHLGSHLCSLSWGWHGRPQDGQHDAGVQRQWLGTQFRPDRPPTALPTGPASLSSARPPTFRFLTVLALRLARCPPAPGRWGTTQGGPIRTGSRHGDEAHAG